MTEKWSELHTAVMIRTAHSCYDQNCTQLLWSELHTAVMIRNAHSCYDQNCTQLLWSELHTAVMIRTAHSCYDQNCTQLLWSELHTAVMIRTAHSCSCKLLFILVRFKWQLNFLDIFSKHPQISNFMNIRRVGADLFHADGRTDG